MSDEQQQAWRETKNQTTQRFLPLTTAGAKSSGAPKVYRCLNITVVRLTVGRGHAAPPQALNHKEGTACYNLWGGLGQEEGEHPNRMSVKE